MKNLGAIIYIDNNYYLYETTSKMIAFYEDDYNKWWWITPLGTFENKSDVKKMYPNASIQPFEKAQIKKFALNKIKEIYDSTRML